MKMITPSFPSNAFGQIDLNSICQLTSPGFAFQKEHLNGKEYADYLTKVGQLNEINVKTNVEVKNVSKASKGWTIETNKGELTCKYLIWEAGEFDNPKISNIDGSEHCTHNSSIKSPSTLDGNHYIIIGGYESGVQMAVELIKNNKKVTLINPTPVNEINTSDPSQVLSPYTLVKYHKIMNSPNYTELIGKIDCVSKENNTYSIQLNDKTIIKSEQSPICATGFSLVQKPIEEFITLRDDSFPLLNEETDELHNQNNIYLTGPSVRHDHHNFCFIYKFRQRFGIIAEDILEKEMYNINDIASLVKTWKRNELYLSDLSCCDEECVC